MEINKKDLLKFIAKAHRNTYAAPPEIRAKNKCKIPISSEHTDYEFVEGDWKYHDSYAGKTWPPGKEIVYFKQKPVWCMAYQGKISEGLSKDFENNQFYPFFKKALMGFDDNLPFRGPKYMKDGDFEYIFELDGDYGYFTGRECVMYKGKEVFFQNVMGSLIK